MVVSTTSAAKSGYTTYQVGIQFGTDVHARDVYALYVSRLAADAAARSCAPNVG